MRVGLLCFDDRGARQKLDLQVVGDFSARKIDLLHLRVIRSSLGTKLRIEVQGRVKCKGDV